jgi:hypothetical protein
LNTVREYVEYQLMSGAVPVASAMQTNELPIAEGTDEKDPNKKQPKKSGLDLSTLRSAAKTAKPASELPKKQEQDMAEGLTNDYFKRRKDEEDRIAGTKAPTKRTPQQTDYAKRRAQEKKVEQGVAEEQVTEMSAGSVATVVNPTPKNKAKVGTLFGGTYKQKKTK